MGAGVMPPLKSSQQANQDRMRSLNTPTPIRVGKWKATGQPRVVEVGGQAVKVATVLDIWKIEDRWWEEPEEQINRTYYQCQLLDEQKVIVFWDEVRQQWFRHHGAFSTPAREPVRAATTTPDPNPEDLEMPTRRTYEEPDPERMSWLMRQGGG